MEERALGGVRWTLASYAANKLITFSSTLVLARLLTPEDFGLVALAVLVIGIIGVFGDLGFGAAQVVRQDLTRRDQRTVFSVTVGSAAVVALVVATAAPLAAAVFGEPRLVPVLSVLAVNTVPTGVGWFFETVLQRELLFARRFVATTAQALTWAGVGVGAAVAGAGIWSLVAAQIAATTVYAATLLFISPYRVWPGFDAGLARDLFASGRGFIVQGGAAFLTQNADFLAVGQVRGPTDLGYYSVAYRLGDLPNKAIADPLAKVAFPGWARMHARGEPVASAYATATRILVLITFPIGMILSAASEPLVLVLYGPQWQPMGEVLTVLGLWAAVRPAESLAGWLLNSVGESGAVGRIFMITLVVFVPTLFIAAYLGGTVGVAATVMLNTILIWVVLARLLKRRVAISYAAQFAALRAPLIAFGPGWVAARITAGTLAEQSPVLAAGTSAVVGLLVFAGVGTLIAPGLLSDGMRQIMRLLRRSQPASSH